jgi:hypothetical protein
MELVDEAPLAGPRQWAHRNSPDRFYGGSRGYGASRVPDELKAHRPGTGNILGALDFSRSISRILLNFGLASPTAGESGSTKTSAGSTRAELSRRSTELIWLPSDTEGR